MSTWLRYLKLILTVIPVFMAVLVAGCGGGGSAAPPVVVAPTVSTTSPATMVASSGAQNLVIAGNGFIAGNVVQLKWGAGAGANVWTTTSATPTITATQVTVSMNPGAVADTINVRVCVTSAATTCSDGTKFVTVTVPVGTVISGTAAAGAPVVGYVSVRDSSSNVQPVKTNIPIAADGKYSVDVAGLTPPFAFLADGTVGGKRVQLYSAGLQADVGGTINITPFTDLMVRNIAGSITTTLVDAIAAKLPALTATQLDAKRVELTTQLTPILQAAGLSTSIDLLRATFNADSTGLDRVLDLVKVNTTVPTAVTITNILDANNMLTVNTATGATTGAIGAGGVTSTPTTPVDLIAQTFANVSNFFATGLPSPTDANLMALFSSDFLDNGRGRDATLTDITSGGTAMIGMKFANVVVDSVDTVSGIALVHFRPVTATGASLSQDMPGGSMEWQMKLEAGVWKAYGNQRIASVQIRATADKNVCTSSNMSGCSVGTTYSTGIHLEIDNKGTAAIGSAVVTGPGLPVRGLTLTQQATQTWFGFTSVGCNGCSTNNYNMTDSQIDAMGAAPYSYTVKLYSNAATPALLATYTEVVSAAPVLNSVLATKGFPSVTSGMTSMPSGGTMTLGWSIPAGLLGDLVSVNVWQSSTSSQYVMADLQGKTNTTGTAILVIPAPISGSWTSRNIWISAWDQNLGKVNTNYQ